MAMEKPKAAEEHLSIQDIDRMALTKRAFERGEYDLKGTHLPPERQAKEGVKRPGNTQYPASAEFIRNARKGK